MASAFYNNYKNNIGKIDWSDNGGTSIKLMLVDASYTSDIDTHLNKSDIDALVVEVTGAGYTSGGEILANRTVTLDTVNDWSKYDADDITWLASTIVARGAIVYLHTGDASTSTLITYIDFAVDKASSDGDFLIQWNTDGVFKIA